MKADRPSSTSLLIARGVLLAAATPELRPLLIGESASLTRLLLNAVPRERWFEATLRHASLSRFAFFVEHLVQPGILLHWLARKRLLDDLAREALQNGCTQLVVLGAGLDTLALRLQREAHCFEIDHPATQTTKRRAIADDGPVFIAADLADTSVSELLRTQPLFDTKQPTLFVAEGLLMYMPPSRVSVLFRELSALPAPGSRFAFTFMEAQPSGYIGFQGQRPILDRWLHWRSEAFQWAVARSEVEGFAATHGWALDSLSSPEELRQRYLAPIGQGDAPLAIGESVAMMHRAA